MRVFITGASGFIGSALVKELTGAGHQVLGLARSETSAKLLTAWGAEVHQGSLEDTDSLKRGAEKADAVIHLAFIHDAAASDFAKFTMNCEVDRLAIEALGDALAGTNRHLIVTSGTGAPTEDATPVANPRLPRVSEKTALAQKDKGVRISVVRLPQVHDPEHHGIVRFLIALAAEKKVSAYIGDGENRLSAVHVLDAALLYRLVLEKGISGVCYHAVGEEGVPLKDIAKAIGRRLKVPVVSKSSADAPAHFGSLAMFAGANLPASNKLTREWLGWHPTHVGLIADIG